ncbi:MAG: TRAP-type C4-dicarboxylate transport system permease small subunit [Myxococcota bacterium]
MHDAESEPAPRFHIPIYDDVLKVAEIWWLLILLLAVIAATFINILDRNFQWGIWDYMVVEKMIYSAVFYIGVFGGVIAARRAKHIAIDAFTHLLRPKPRLYLAAALQAVSAVVAFMIAHACYVWVMTIVEPDAGLLPAHPEWYLNARLWRWPVVVGFGLMSLHFAVNSLRFSIDGFLYRAPTEADG